MGGAAFPVHAKLASPKDAAIDTLIINGAECEPYLTCDHRVMLEYPDDVMRGTQLAMRASGALRAVIGVRGQQARCGAGIARACAADGSITVEAVETKYPRAPRKP